MSNAHVWRAALSRLRSIASLTSAEVDNWLQGAQLVEISDGVARLQVRTTYEGDMISKRYYDVIVRALSDVVGTPVALEVQVAGPGGPNRAVTRSRRPAIPAHAAYARSLFAVEADDDGEEEPVRSPIRQAPRSHAGDERENGRVAPQPSFANLAQRSRSLGADGPMATGAAGGRGENETPSARVDRRTERASGATAHEARSASSGVNSMRDDDTGDLGRSTLRYDDMAGSGGRVGQMQRRPNESEPTPGITPIAPPRLNERYTFSTFIVGSSNQLAYAASQAVADAPGREYNPLFLYGGVGLGKTHLLHAIGHTAVQCGLTVLYVSSETFTNEIVNAILSRQTQEFRAKYRSVDVLLVDDIQFIAGKDSTEEEFFHTFNTLYETNRQIVICSDRPPKAIVSLEERLRSRFEWGLIADIQPPDLETRIAILRAKAELSGKRIADEVILYLANRVQSNIRELEGSLNRVLAFADLQGLPMTIETAKSAMASLASDTRQRRVSIDDVANAVAEHYHISLADLQGKQRDKHIVTPRQVAMYLMRQETDASLLEIGQALGGRDHSTVLHGCEKIARGVNESTTLRKEVMAIRQQLVG